MITAERRSLFVAVAGIAAGALVWRPALASWDAHLARLTSAIKCKAALFGPDSVQWAGLSQLAPPTAEVRYIVAGFAKPGSLFAAGPTLLAVKYMCTRADAKVILGKRGSDGFVACAGLGTVTLCKFSEADVTPAQALVATQNFVAYMASLGY